MITNTILFISGGEIFFILIVALLLFGSKKLPEVARGLGKGVREFRKVSNEIKREITQETDIIKDIKDIKDNITKDL